MIQSNGVLLLVLYKMFKSIMQFNVVLNVLVYGVYCLEHRLHTRPLYKGHVNALYVCYYVCCESLYSYRYDKRIWLI